MVDTTVSARVDQLKSLVDVLLPGDGHFPAASVVGAHGVLAERLRERLGIDGVDQVLAALDEAAVSMSLAALGPDERFVAVQRFQEREPVLFALLLNALYYSYYQSPLVIEAIRGLGIVYNDAPQPLGYSMAPFDPAPGVGVPTQPRGFYVKTEDARRVELPPAARATEAEL